MGQGRHRHLYSAAVSLALLVEILRFFVGDAPWIPTVWALIGVLWIAAGVAVFTQEAHRERWLYLASAALAILAALSAYVAPLALSSTTWGALSVALFGGAIFRAALRYGWAHWLYLAPTLGILGFVLVYPTIVTAVVSLYEDFYGRNRAFVGLENYVDVLTSSEGLLAIGNTLLWLVLMTSATVGFGLILAILLDRVRYESIAKSVIFMPMAISFTATSIIWKFVYAFKPASIPQIGVLNELLMSLGAFAARPVVSGVLNGLVIVFGVLTLALLLGAIIRIIWDALRQWQEEQRLPWMGYALVASVLAIGAAFVLDSADGGVAGFLGQALWILGPLVLLVTAMRDRSLGPALLGSLILFALADFLLSLQGFQPNDWVRDPWLTNNIAIIVEGIWVWTGFAMVVLSAAYKGIPPQMLEAARIDGANEWQVFWHITIPFMKSTIAVVTTTILVFVLKIFDFVWVTTGGNFKTHVLATLMVENLRTNQGRAAVLAMLIMLMVIPIILINVRRFQAQEELR